MKASKPSSPARSAAGLSPSPTPRTPDRFSLAGPSLRLDPRVHAVRGDIADVALADRVFAPHYARPLMHSCSAGATPMRAAPARSATAVSELLKGEAFAVVDCGGEWAWGYGLHDNYVGYVEVAALGAPIEPTHIVSTPAALIFAAPDIKSPVVEWVPMGARLAATGEDGRFLAVANGFVHQQHVSALAETAADYVEVATRLTGTPYRWGGRSGDGIDCSGLVQLALAFAGITAPRDSDQQAASLGEPLAEGSALRRGDFVFLPGHVGMMANDTHLLHANAHWMRVVMEPLTDVLARQPEGKGITALRRFG